MSNLFWLTEAQISMSLDPRVRAASTPSPLRKYLIWNINVLSI